MLGQKTHEGNEITVSSIFVLEARAIW